MDKFIKNAAIYLNVKSEKEDQYFISQKIEKIKEKCKSDNIIVTHIFVISEAIQEELLKSKYLEKQIEKNQIQFLITENNMNLSLNGVEVKEVTL